MCSAIYNNVSFGGIFIQVGENVASQFSVQHVLHPCCKPTMSNKLIDLQMTYSSSYDVVSPFTRDFDLLKSKLGQLEEQDKSCLEPVLAGVNKLVLGEWGSATPCQVSLLTLRLS